MRTMLSSLSAVLLLGVIATACGGSDGSEVEGAGNKGQGASSSTGGTPILGGGTTGTGTGGNGTGSTGTVIKPDDACATGTANAALSGVNMIVMFDRSSSMTEAANDAGDTRWDLTSAALKAFFADPEEAGLKLALRFFPHDLPAEGCRKDEDDAPGCNVNACAMPLVSLGTLTADAAPTDAHEKALLDATEMSAPNIAQGTPIFAALAGALEWAGAQRTMTPSENSVVVLVTDGEANGCNNNIGDISQLAADAFAENQIRTYAIGLTGSQESDMDEIAEAGGTEQGIFVADGNNATQQLKDALGAIRGQVLDCDFPMPEAKPGLDVDPALINVNYTPGGGTATTLTQVAGADACGANPSWYYDNATAPTRIILCKNTCDTITADATASLQILLGCATSSDVPK